MKELSANGDVKPLGFNLKKPSMVDYKAPKCYCFPSGLRVQCELGNRGSLRIYDTGVFTIFTHSRYRNLYIRSLSYGRM